MINKNIRDIIFTVSTFAISTVAFGIAGAGIGYGLETLINSNTTVIEQSKETYEAVKNLAVVGAGIGGLYGMGLALDLVNTQFAYIKEQQNRYERT